MSWYSKARRDPRWQKKRLQIMERDDWKCCNCGARDKTLNVHHRYYITGHQPWEYEDSALQTLCEPCHRGHHGIATSEKQECGNQTLAGQKVNDATFMFIECPDAEWVFKTSTTHHEDDDLNERIVNKRMTRRDVAECHLLSKLFSDPSCLSAINNSYLSWLSWEVEEIYHELVRQRRLTSSSGSKCYALELTPESVKVSDHCLHRARSKEGVYKLPTCDVKYFKSLYEQHWTSSKSPLSVGGFEYV